MLQQQINLTFGRKKAPPVLKTVQNDTGRQLVAEIADYTIPSGAAAEIRATLPDGTTAMAAGTIDGQTVTAPLDELLTAEGKAAAQIRITNGGEVTTFAFFVDVTEDLAGETEEATAGPAEVATFETDAALPLTSLVVEIEPKQDLNGYEKPWPAGGGVNKFKYNASVGTQIINGVTWTLYEDGSIQVSGTASNASAFRYVLAERVEDDDFYFSGNYKFHAFLANISTKDFHGGVKIGSKWYSVYASGYLIALNNADGKIVEAWFQVRDGKTVNATIRPMIYPESESTPTAWSPYSNICPITGTEEVTVARCGVNIWDEEWEVGYIRVADGTDTPGTNNIRSKNYIPVIPSAEYYLHTGLSTAIYCPLIFYDENKNFVSAVVRQVWNRTIIIPSNAYFVRFYMGSTYGTTYNHDISINYPSTDHAYHAYQGETTTTDLGRTVYGGTVDLVTGVLTVTHKSVTPPSSDYANNGTTGTLYEFSLNNLTDKAAGSTNFICSNMMVSANRAEYSARGRDTGQTIIFCLPTSVANNITSARAWVDSNPIQTVYELATPQTYQLTPSQIVALLGGNTIWSNAGQVTVKYRRREAT